MSYRKTKLIQERNLLLERKYILEQAPPPPPPPPPTGGTPPPPPPPTGSTPPPPTGSTPPPPTGSTPPPPTGSTPSTSGTTDEKISVEKIKKAQPCSDMPTKIDETKNEKKTIKIDGKEIIYFLGSNDKSVVFCSDYKKKMA